MIAVHTKKYSGFSLVEMLLVLAIVSSILLTLMSYYTSKTSESRRDLAVMQAQQILNASLSYYVNNSKWPNTIDNLKKDGYLSNKPSINNPWGSSYTFYKNSKTGVFAICSLVTGRQITTPAKGSTPEQKSYTSAADAGVIASRLPLGYVAAKCTDNSVEPYDKPAPDALERPSLCESTTCAVVSAINIPGQNLNSARSVNFAGLYHNGACVPAPICPNPYSASNQSGMKPTILVTPAAVSGNYLGTNQVFPLNSFTAYAVGKGGTGTDMGDPVQKPVSCTAKNPNTSPEPTDCNFTTGPGIPSPNGLYWRVCLDVVTERGRIEVVNRTAMAGTIMAITRCVPNNEPFGSHFDVFESF